MKALKYIGAGICMLLALAQLVSIYFIASGLIQGHMEENTAYFTGKLAGHVLVMVAVLVVASKLVKSVINDKNSHKTDI